MNGPEPNVRSVRQLRALESAGWDISILSCGADPTRVAATRSNRRRIRLAVASDHLITARRRAAIAELDGHLAAARERIVEASRAIRAARNGLGQAPGEGEESRLRQELATAQQDAQRLAHHKRSLHAASRCATPFGRAETFGDLVRLESFWDEAATALVRAEWDVAQAVDLQMLPPLVWAREALTQSRPIAYEAQDLFAELGYLPAAHRAGWEALARTFVPLADLVLTVCDPAAQHLVAAYGARTPTIVPNYPEVAAARGDDLRRRLRLGPDAHLAVHIGALRINRRSERLLEFAQRIAGLHVACLGVDPDAPTVRELHSDAAAMGLSDRVHLIPPVPGELVVDLVRTADLSLITYSPDDLNLTVAWPNKLFESLAAGVPVVAARGTEAATYVEQQQVGRSFDPDDARSMVSAVTEVTQDPGFRRRAGRLAPEVTWQAAATDYVAAIRGLL